MSAVPKSMSRSIARRPWMSTTISQYVREKTPSKNCAMCSVYACFTRGWYTEHHAVDVVCPPHHRRVHWHRVVRAALGRQLFDVFTGIPLSHTSLPPSRRHGSQYVFCTWSILWLCLDTFRYTRDDIHRCRYGVCLFHRVSRRAAYCAQSVWHSRCPFWRRAHGALRLFSDLVGEEDH